VEQNAVVGGKLLVLEKNAFALVLMQSCLKGILGFLIFTYRYELCIYDDHQVTAFLQGVGFTISPSVG
jgi:hypothetical protein